MSFAHTGVWKGARSVRRAHSWTGRRPVSNEFRTHGSMEGGALGLHRFDRLAPVDGLAQRVVDHAARARSLTRDR